MGIEASAASVRAMVCTEEIISTVSTMMIHNPAIIAFGEHAEMKKAIDLLASINDSINNAYELKTGLSLAKLSHMMDSETWMDAGKAVELGFADEVMKPMISGNINPPATSMYSKAAVVNSLTDKIAEKCKTTPKPKDSSIDTRYERLNLLK